MIQQNVHIVYNVLFQILISPVIFMQNHYDIRIWAGHKVSNDCASASFGLFDP